MKQVEKLLVFGYKITDKPIEQTKPKPQKTIEIKITKSTATLSFQSPLELKQNESERDDMEEDTDWIDTLLFRKKNDFHLDEEFEKEQLSRAVPRDLGKSKVDPEKKLKNLKTNMWRNKFYSFK